MGAQAWVALVGAGLAAVALVGAGLAAVAAFVTWQQKNRADRRSEWWRRITWAFEQTFNDKDDIQAELGWSMIDTLGRSPLVTKDDSDMVQLAATHLVKYRPVTRSFAVRRAAARAAVTASKKTGRPVDPEVAALAGPEIDYALAYRFIDPARPDLPYQLRFRPVSGDLSGNPLGQLVAIGCYPGTPNFGTERQISRAGIRFSDAEAAVGRDRWHIRHDLGTVDLAEIAERVAAAGLT